MIKICLLTLNEVKGCIEFFENRDLTHKNVFAVDGGSKDGTIEFLEDQGVKVINQEKRNYNGAYKLAFNEVGPDDCIIFFHPKQTIDSKIIIKI